MTHADLDPVIYPWSEKFGLHIYTQMRYDEIRAIEIVDDAGDIYQMSIIPLGGENQTVAISLWDKKKESAEYRTSLPSLAECLDEAYAKAAEWITARGHTRTIYGLRASGKPC